MGDPNYVYQPWSAEKRRAASEKSREIRGIPKGYRQLYGINVPEKLYPQIQPLVHYVRQKLPHDLEAVRTLITALVRISPLLQREERLRLHRALAVLSIRDLEPAERRARSKVLKS